MCWSGVVRRRESCLYGDSGILKRRIVVGKQQTSDGGVVSNAVWMFAALIAVIWICESSSERFPSNLACFLSTLCSCDASALHADEVTATTDSRT